MHGNVPVRFGRGRLDSLGNKGLAAYLITILRLLQFFLFAPRNENLCIPFSGAVTSSP